MSQIRTALITGFALVLAQPVFALSSFNEVREVLLDHKVVFDSPEAQAEADAYRKGDLPRFEVTTAKLFSAGFSALKNAGVRTTTQHDDYYPRLAKLVHSNGVCFTGEWNMTEKSDYTGLFEPGTRALFVGRVSTTMGTINANEDRGFGFAGKIFPTENADEKVETANFFTVDVGLGQVIKHFADTSLTNEPELGKNWSVLRAGLRIAGALRLADKNPGFRPLYPIAQSSLKSGQVAKVPHWIKIEPAATVAKVDESDFRKELDVKNHPEGLRMNVFVSDTTKDRTVATGWTRLGSIDLKESFVSYGCDRQLHFPHPKLEQAAK